ncbi:MAG TPA: ornithine cyclodeaminase family protein [Anaerolineales bacterium]|nr:ornithine cyclodeaminase family protein [Anaerolineales bacterium]
MLILNYHETAARLPMLACIDVMEQAFRLLAEGQVYHPPRQWIDPAGALGSLLLMPSYLGGAEPVYGLKTLTIFHQNTAMGLEAHQGAVLLFSGKTGELLALFDASAITAIRTAAVSGLATRLLANPTASVCALLGGGVQARTHLAAMACVRPLSEVRIVSRSLENAQKFVETEQSKYDFPLLALPSAESAVRSADLVVTTTTSHTPVLHGEWLQAGTHVVAIGAYRPTTREVDTATIQRARVFVDSRQQCLQEAGDLAIPIQEGAFSADGIVAELSELVSGQVMGRTDASQITFFKSVGLPVEDLAAAQYIYNQP